MENIEVKQSCTYCHGTGDYRGKHAEGKSDFKSFENRCLHCNGTGIMTLLFSNYCKYCGTPCNGYCCKRCFKDFEGE